jgi:hypothetical protein
VTELALHQLLRADLVDGELSHPRCCP